MADNLHNVDVTTILNDVVSNRFSAQFGKGDDAFRDQLTARIVHQLQQDGFCYPSTSGYKGLKTMLFSVLSCHTTAQDIDASAEKIIEIYHMELEKVQQKEHAV